MTDAQLIEHLAEKYFAPNLENKAGVLVLWPMSIKLSDCEGKSHAEMLRCALTEDAKRG